MQLHRVVAVAMAVGLVGTACGARVSRDERSAAANAILSSSGSGTTGGTQATDGTTDTSSLGQQPGSDGNASGPTTNGTTGNSQPTTSGQTSTTTHGNQSTTTTKPGKNGQQTTTAGASCPTSGKDVGLTSNSIVLGGVADISGPVSGLFAGAKQGLAAFQAYANSQGGICGHQVQIQFGDSGTNCSQNQNVTEGLVNKVFAFVGNFSLYDGTGCGGKVIKDNPTVPDISVAIDPSLSTLKNHYDFAPGVPGYGTGMFAYYAKKFGTKVQRAGTITENIPSVLAKQKVFVHTAESQGWKFVYQNAASPTSSNFTSNFQQACGRDHIQVFFTETVNAQYAATMLANERSVAACKGVINVMGIAYDSALLGFYQGNPDDLIVYGWTPNALFFNADEAKNIPEVALFQQWFRRTNPGQPLNLYAMYVWSAGRLMQQAIENAGPTLTRKTALASLDRVKNFDENGLLIPSTPSSKTTGGHCYLLFELRHSTFSRVDDPATGFRCDGRFLPLN
ncbi:MAG: ABC transporter substrate-binding protein [Frankiaceae bacterium]|nr:ABC transporter substrate-binding protein [Frankiaceae bacterium]MBV9871894.1 ABC transporter substrate-binding protein [Frankiaceae bacterium]